MQDALKNYLWDEEKKAFYDKDKENKTMPILLHNNLRCMYFGSFDQDMADKFVRVHFLNPSEFRTPMPLPSMAANDPMFKNEEGNNWSGQPGFDLSEVNTSTRELRTLCRIDNDR